MTNLCQYSNRFGKPGEGVHSYRIFNIAIVDLGLTVLAAYLIYFFCKKVFHWQLSFWIYLIILLLIGIISHRAFCVRTTVDKFLFP
jgi:hypothetical protein